MHFVKLDGSGNIIAYPYTIETLRNEHRNVSFPQTINNSILERWNVFPVTMTDKPSYNQATHRAYPGNDPYFNGSSWMLDWVIVEKTEYEIRQDTEQRKKEVRQARDKLLMETDWMSIRSLDINSPVDPEWAAYRQSLRDVTAQEGFPWNVVWPTDPTGFTYTE